MRTLRLLAVAALGGAVVLGGLALAEFFRVPAVAGGIQAGDFVRVEAPSIALYDSIDGTDLESGVRDGDRLLLVGGPHAAGSHIWYRVEHFSRNGSTPYGIARFAWLAVPAGQPWLAEYEPECPARGGSMEVTRLAALNAAEVLHCFGREPLRLGPVIARLEHPEIFEAASPEWLAVQPGLQLYGRNGWDSNDGSIGGHLVPGRVDLPTEEWLEVTGHFDDPASTGCRRTPLHPEFGPMAEDAVLWCRQQFVIDEFSPAATPDATPPPPEVSGRWQRLPRAPLDGREGHSAVWTGTEMILWGGRTLETHNAQTVEFAWNNDGAAYDPATQRWRMIARAPIPGRDGHAAVWTGTEMLVWGGAGPNGRPLAGGGRYDPSTDTWRKIPAAPLEDFARLSVAQGAWTGERLLVWSGTSVASYDPQTNDWESLPSIPAPLPDSVAVSDAGDGVIALVYPTGISTRVQAYRFDDQGDSWHAIPEPPLLALDAGPPVWTGEDILVFSYAGAEGVGDAVPPNTFYAARLSVASLTWTVDLAPQYFHSYPVVWSGEAVYFPLGEGVFDNGTRSWSSLPPRPATATEGFSLVWADDQLIMWGGSAGESFLPLDEGWTFER